MLMLMLMKRVRHISKQTTFRGIWTTCLSGLVECNTSSELVLLYVRNLIEKRKCAMSTPSARVPLTPIRLSLSVLSACLCVAGDKELANQFAWGP
ncbi:hypothetical protein KQX54_003715 [Cotesia glomerata]|uniref:Secreted protein n=1 Tax=Cotesia glomerata TaxID=32391 RepID=A0AAV7HST9_COTGL|nr:hypothetical protein KQX54_003715 [Cotesia glomerata]